MLKWARRVAPLALLVCFHLAAEVRSLTILHTNDIHARVSPSETGEGGFAYLASVIRSQRANCSDCILLNAGDLVQGAPVSTIFHGLPVYEIANLFGFDAGTFGNHEFDYGWPQARKFSQTARYPLVSANIVDGRNRLFAPAPYVILKVNKLRVAVIGALTDEMGSLSTPKLMGDWRTTPVIAAVRKYAAELRNKSDLIVLLGHINAEEERRFLAEAPEIPVIVTGHIHNGMAREMTRDGRVLVRVRANGEELGRLELKVDTNKKAPVSWDWKRIPIDSSKVAPAADVAAQVKRWENEVTTRVDKPLAVSGRKFDKPGVKALIERAMREETGADFAFMNLGGVRDVLPQGQLLVRHIWGIMPFDNMVVIAKVKGRDMPAAALNGRHVEPDREYTLAVSDFTAANQSARSQLGTTGLKFGDDVGMLRDMLIDWFRKMKVVE